MLKKLWKNKGMILAIILTLGLISLPIFHFIFMVYLFAPALDNNHKKLTEYFPQILADLRVLNENPPFP